MRLSSRPTPLLVLQVAVMIVPLAVCAQEGRRAVNVDNFKRVETDLYFAKLVAGGNLGVFQHAREPVPIDRQDVIRMNRDTLYSSLVVDFDAGPVVVTLPDTGGRFMGMQVIDEDHYTVLVEYRKPGGERSKSPIGTLHRQPSFVRPSTHWPLLTGFWIPRGCSAAKNKSTRYSICWEPLQAGAVIRRRTRSMPAWYLRQTTAARPIN